MEDIKMDYLNYLIHSYWYIILLLAVIVVLIIKHINTQQKLKIKYPDLAKKQRNFMYNVVEKYDKVIYKTLVEKRNYKVKKGVINRVLRNATLMKVQVIYSSDDFKTDIVVVFSSDKKDRFYYNKLEHSLDKSSRDNIEMILNMMNI
jgi:predicted alpha-1,6-mannanase (GH76 family)